MSLYPYVNKHCEYPIGHPKIIISNFSDIRSYFGFVHCVVECPDRDHFPVLPVAIRSKLIFPLCKTCAEENEQSYCTHRFGQRYLRGTWTTAELHYAMDRGYKVVEVFEVWHWTERRKGLFSKYVDTFMKIKIESSGWPSYCVDEESKDAFVRQVQESEGIQIEKDKVVKNPGWRKIAKDMLNNFWGKYGQSDELSKTELIHDPRNFLRKSGRRHARFPTFI